MDVTAAAVAFGQAAKACVELGYEIFQRYRAYKHADDRLAELILRTEASWLKTAAQIELLNKIRHDLDSRLLECFDASLLHLQTKLSLARIEIEALTNHESGKFSLEKISLTLTKSKRARYSIFERHVRKTVLELKEWQNEFDPSWLFTIRLTSDKVDSALTNQLQDTPDAVILDNVKAVRAVLREIEKGGNNKPAVFKEDSFVARPGISRVLPCSELVVTKTSDSSQNVILDTTYYPSNPNADEVKKQVGDLARILMHGEPTILGLLQCLGALRLTATAATTQKYQLIYSIPDSLTQPATLRCMLSELSMSLDVKFGLARTLARGVASVHAAGFVHKNIRPETVLTFLRSSSKTRVAFLVGFERFRGILDGTTLTGDMVWHRNLYRHPQRQGNQPDFMYQMQHDIYSLGVCLLEIGLWESFVLQIDPPQSGASLDITNELGMNNKRQAALDIKKKLIKLASDKLPASMGLVYTEVVISCLTCLDPNATNMFVQDKDLRDRDGILVGMLFIEIIYKKLLSITFS